jgi:hypothetical protein
MSGSSVVIHARNKKHEMGLSKSAGVLKCSRSPLGLLFEQTHTNTKATAFFFFFFFFYVSFIPLSLTTTDNDKDEE